MATPVVAILALSDSFQAIWDTVVDECGGHSIIVNPGETLPAQAAAVVISAGGEEDQALDALATLEQLPNRPIFVVGATTSHRVAIEAIRRGAQDFFGLPHDMDPLRRVLTAAVETSAIRQDQELIAGDAFKALRGKSSALQAVLRDAQRVAPHGTTVLIQGETGTGKELLARGIHDGGQQASGPFVAVNCAAIPETLLESELFGHERGAFTDAHQSKPGLFEEAHRGTILLDEIGHLPVALQGKILRVLEDGQFRRVGGTRTLTVDVRVVAASNVDLSTAVREGRFREDLFYRLNVVRLELPPLRERGEDVLHLAEYFLTVMADRYELEPPPLSPDARSALLGHDWPGNVRELRHAIERALLLSDPGRLDPRHLVGTDPGGGAASRGALPFPATLEVIEARAAVLMLERCDGNKSAAARALGISRARLQRLLDPGGNP